MTQQFKPWFSIEQQVARIESRGMTDAHEFTAEFARIGYYWLSGYWKVFRVGGSGGGFVSGARFAHVMALYRFDDTLRATLFASMEKIEIALRVRIGHVLGTRDPLGHVHPEALRPNLSRNGWERFVRNYENSRRNSDEDFEGHYGADYDGELPVWAAVELLSFGDLKHLYGYLRDEDRGVIAKTLGVKASTLDAWLDPLNDLRNVCAHHRRIWDREFELNGKPIAMERVIGIVATLLHALGESAQLTALRDCMQSFPADLPNNVLAPCVAWPGA